MEARIIQLCFSLYVSVIGFPVTYGDIIRRQDAPYGFPVTCGDIIRRLDAPLCYGVACANGGTLNNDTCTCICKESTTGLFCEKEMLLSDWPKGQYGLPRSTYGCPETQSHGWATGYIDMKSPDSSSRHDWFGELYPHLMGPFDSHRVRMNFCVKILEEGRSETWPSGSYCIYKVGATCPKGFDSGSVDMTGYQFSVSDMSGWLPSHSLTKVENSTTVAALEIFYCCKSNDSVDEETFTFGTGLPFYVVKNSEDCPPGPPGMRLDVEFFNYSSGMIAWSYTGVYPQLLSYFTQGAETNVKIDYCYYSPHEQTEWKRNATKYNSTSRRLLSKEKPINAPPSVKINDNLRIAYDGLYVQLPTVSITFEEYLQIDMLHLHKIVYVDVYTIGTSSYLGTPSVSTGLHSFDTSLSCVSEKTSKIKDFEITYRSTCPDEEPTQYVTIHGFSAAIKEIDIVVEGNYCGRQMGIVSGMIQDFQVTSSVEIKSEQNPNGMICLQSTDENLYIQVDLIVPMVVQGLTLQVVDTDNDPDPVSFRVYHGLSIDQLTLYKDPTGNQVFDFSRPVGYNKMWFSYDILATFVKINIIGYGGRPCFILELLGCPRYVTRDVRCENGSTEVGWSNVKGKIALSSVNNPDTDFVPDVEECKLRCISSSQCLSMTWQKSWCSLFEFQRYAVYSSIKTAADSVYGEKLCLTDVKSTDSCEYDVMSPGVLTSPQYPMYYGEDRVCTWHVTFPADSFIRLHILEIDLPVIDDQLKGICEDKIIIAEANSSKNDQVKLDKEKHRFSILYSSTNELYIQLTACYRYSKVNIANISRFVMNISESGLPGCGFISESHKHDCLADRGILASPFYPSNYFLTSEVFWIISGSTKQYIELLFLEIDIPSDEQCSLSSVGVSDIRPHQAKKAMEIGRYCTENRNFNIIRSRWNALELDMISTFDKTGFGFMAMYEMKPIEFDDEWKANISFECPNGWVQREESCYKFVQHNENVSQAYAEAECRNYSGHLLSVGSRDEMMFIHNLLVTEWSSFTPVIIGLYKDITQRGFEQFRWTDGNIATYFDWHIDPQIWQPDGFNSERCTVIQVGSLWSTQSWYDYMCAYNRYHNFICEVTMESQGIIIPTQIDPLTEPPNKSWLFTCQNRVIISHVYVCDGVKDCADFSDEQQCGDKQKFGQFKCEDGTFIHMSLYCDYKADCVDEWDEKFCKYRECNVGEWRCDNKQCISEHERCDFKTDCADKSDEDQCDVCVNEGFQCFDEQCIPSTRVNDGFVDCSGDHHEDEPNGLIKPAVESCEAWYRLGMRQDGIYNVNYGGLDSFRVECTFPKDSGSSTVTVVLHHNLEGRQQLSAGQHRIKYDANVDQIQRLKTKANCKQSVHVECSGFGVINHQLFWNDTTFQVLGYKQHSRCGYSGLQFRLTREYYMWFSETTYIPQELLPVPAIEEMAFPELHHGVFVSPVICEEEIQNTTNDKFQCKNGVIINIRHLCILNLDENGETEGCRDLSHLQNCGNSLCPKTHVKCPGSFCIPRHMFCDGIKHCPNGADEIQCEKASCSGLFKCRNSTVCLPVSEVCNGIARCKFRDDELLCDFDCPANCICEGLVVTCTSFAELKKLSNRVRKLKIHKAEANDHTQLSFSHFLYLGQLIVTHTNVESLNRTNFPHLGNLLYVDLSKNLIRYLDADTFTGLNNLAYLNVSQNRITSVAIGTFERVPKLHILDIRGNQIETFHDHLFEGLSVLRYLYTDEFKFCCVKPQSVSDESCFPSADEFSSCEDMMRDEILRGCLWTIGSLALIGNGLSIVYRLGFDRVSLQKSHGIFVLNLCAADFLMGVYLFIIASADQHFRGRYIYHEYSWRNSIGCKVAGFIATLSSEASTTILCLITFDRVLAIKYPFSSVRFNAFRAKLSLSVVWGINVCIAALPLLHIPYFDGKFYSKSGTCLALPLTRDRPSGWEYSVAVFLGYNLMAFVVIVVGQITIYMAIRSTSAAVQKTGRQEQNIALARNLFLIVFTDFLCWFPIAVMGLVALCGHAIPGEIYAWTTVFILPINSALNPLLYTLKAFMQKRKTSRHQKQITELTTDIDTLQHKISRQTAAEKDKSSHYQKQISELTTEIETLQLKISCLTEAEKHDVCFEEEEKNGQIYTERM